MQYALAEKDQIYSNQYIESIQPPAVPMPFLSCGLSFFKPVSRQSLSKL